MKLLLAVVACGLFAQPCEAQTDGWPLHLALSGYMAVSGADLSVTMFKIGAGEAREANPFMAPFVGSPVAVGGIKMAAAAGTSWALLRLHQTHPRIAFWTAVAGTAFYTGVVVHNARIGRSVYAN